MLIDVVLAAAIVGAVIVVLAAGVRQYGIASQRMAEQRRAVYLAETVLVAMQAGREIPRAAADSTVQMELPAGGEAIAGYRWVRVVVNVGEREAALVGLVPEDAPGGAE